MIQRTKKEVEAKVNELWPGRPWTDRELDITVGPTVTTITLTEMYDPPGLSFAQLMALSEFFDTKNINDADRIYENGCETCDYGSKYGWTLEITA